VGNLILGYLRDTVGMLKAMHIHAAFALFVFIIAVFFFRKETLNKGIRSL